jgi:hypothetical protein
MNLIKLDILYNNNFSNKTDVLIGDILYKIFDKELDIKEDEYEVFSINNDNDYLKNILNIMTETDNKICCYQENIYVTPELKTILDTIKSNKYSPEYNKYLLKSCLITNDIFIHIDKLDLDKFNSVHKSQYNLIKKIHNKHYLPINYCKHKIRHMKNKLAKDILIQMADILSNYDYEIDPCIFDFENIDDYTKQLYSDISSYIDYWIEQNNYLLCRYLTIFQINYANKDFIFSLLRHPLSIDKILKTIEEKNIYNNEDFLKLLLVLNKVNYFVDKKQDIIIDNTLLSSVIYFDAKMSFFYLLDNYVDTITFDKILLKDDFLKIYLYFVSKKDNKNILLNEYLINVIKLNKIHTIDIISILKLIENHDLKLITEIVYLLINNNSVIKEIFKLNANIKSILKTNNILFNILDNTNEELFYYLIGLFEDDKIFTDLLDTDNNTLYHYICKNNICLGFKINNKLRNKKGFKPLDLCTVNKKYYKL